MTKPLPPGAPRKKPGTKTGRKGHNALSSARNISSRRKQAEALELRLAGANLQQIADKVGFADPSGAYRSIQSALATILPEATRDEARKRELATLDRVQLAHMQDALRGDEKAAGVVLRCIAQRCKIQGLEAPDQLVISGGGEPIRIELGFDPSPPTGRAKRRVEPVLELDPALVDEEAP